MNNYFNPNSLIEENKRALKLLFKGKINTSFLIKIKSQIEKIVGPEIFKYYDMQPNNLKFVTASAEAPEYEICRMIVGTHKHNTLFFTSDKVREKEKDEKYQETLASQVVEKIRMRNFGSLFFRKQQLIGGDEFLYFPVPYELFVMCMRSLYLMSEKANDNVLFNYYTGIVKDALGALTLLENNFLNNAYPMCRTMLENYMKILILRKHPAVIDTYMEFCKFEIDQSCCSQEYPQKFFSYYNKRKLQTQGNKVNFLHFGWLDSIKSYDTETKNRYSINGIIDYLIETSLDKKRNELENIKCYYKMCNGYIHGSVAGAIPLLHYFEISSMIYYVMKNIFEFIISEPRVESTNEDSVLMETLERDYSKLKEQYNDRSTENFKLYYSKMKINNN